MPELTARQTIVGAGPRVHMHTCAYAHARPMLTPHKEDAPCLN